MSVLVDAFDTTFRSAYEPAPSWGAWRSFLCALDGGAMTAEELEIYKRCTGRSLPPPPSGFKEAWVPAGRGGGKSAIAAEIAVATACFIDWQPFLRPGETARVLVMSMSKDQAAIILDYALGLVEMVPHLKRRVVSTDSTSIVFDNCVEIVVVAANFRTVRGHTVVLAVLDECAFFRSDESANPDVEIVNALKPALAVCEDRASLASAARTQRRACFTQSTEITSAAMNPTCWCGRRRRRT